MIKTTLRAEQHFTLAGEQSGQLVAALSVETTPDLQAAYRDCRCGSGWADRLFGNNARRWENFLAAELNRRGIEAFAVQDIFGTHTFHVSAYK